MDASMLGIMIILVVFIVALCSAHAFPAVEVDANVEGVVLTVRRRALVDVAVRIDQTHEVHRPRVAVGRTLIPWSEFANGAELSHLAERPEWSAAAMGSDGRRRFEASASFNRVGENSALAQAFRYTPSP